MIDMEDIKRNIENSKLLGQIDGKVYVLESMISGFCSDDNPLKKQITDIKQLINKIEL